MTITVVLKDEAADIVERQLAEGRFPDAASAVTAALALLDDVSLDWSAVDGAAVQRMIAAADAEGGAVIEAARRR
jgi:Arc/MetJ-type ribon-helix-helix transcriptional regulator